MIFSCWHQCMLRPDIPLVPVACFCNHGFCRCRHLLTHIDLHWQGNVNCMLVQFVVVHDTTDALERLDHIPLILPLCSLLPFGSPFVLHYAGENPLLLVALLFHMIPLMLHRSYFCCQAFAFLDESLASLIS